MTSKTAITNASHDERETCVHPDVYAITAADDGDGDGDAGDDNDNFDGGQRTQFDQHC